MAPLNLWIQPTVDHVVPLYLLLKNKKKSHITRLMQFKPVLFKGQLCLLSE